MKDYASLLRARARHMPQREDPERVHSALDERNARGLAEWRRRWALYYSPPDPWAGVGRARDFLDLSLEMKRRRARAWLDDRAFLARLKGGSPMANAQPSNVLTLRRRGDG